VREGERGCNAAAESSPEETDAVLFRTDGFGWGTSESMHAKSTEHAGSWLRTGCEVGLVFTLAIFRCIKIELCS
jgi:hypothetical protein